MSRFVSAKPTKSSRPQLAGADSKANELKEYAERVAKYVPAEILAAFTTLNGVFASTEGDLWYWGLLCSTILLWILTPVYFAWMKEPEDDPSFKKQLWMSFIAFIIWAYVISGDGGIFGSNGLNIYISQIGVALMVFFTLVSGFIVPRKS